MQNTTNLAVLGGLVLTLIGCVGPVEIAPLPYAHPANPDAPGGTLPPLGTGLNAFDIDRGDKPDEMTGHDAHSAGNPKAPGRYQCPMHAEVRSHTPGRCPVCGMKLVGGEDGVEQLDGHRGQ